MTDARESAESKVPSEQVVRLFPLPGLVLFPNIVQALHIFEMRYRQMLEHAMADDQLIGMAVLGQGWEPNYEGPAPIEPIVCVGKIVSCTKLANGCSNIILLGQHRARIVQEIDDENLYRSAHVELLPDTTQDSSSKNKEQCCELHRELLSAFEKVMPKSALATAQLTKNLADNISLPLLTDLIAYTLEITPVQKLKLLAETSVISRAQSLIEHLNALIDGQCASLPKRKCFPPDFSAN